MEISLVRKRLRETLERARHQAVERRAANDAASQSWDRVREQVVVPLAHQVAQVLKAEGYPFQVFTPGGAVRLGSERSSEDYIELSLETGGAEPAVIARISRARGREVTSEEREVSRGSGIDELSDDQMLEFLARALARLVER